MPKRDEAYMLGQRNAFTQAAVECLLNKGLVDTSMQDVARAAGVSLGTLYIHFTDKFELVLAACRASYGGWSWPNKPPSSWADYVAEIDQLRTYYRSDRGRRRIRLSLQIVAELVMNQKKLPGFAEWYDELADTMQQNLQALHDNGEISLPLGLQQTVMTHMLLYHGATYCAVANRNIDIDAVVTSLKSSLALTAGAKSQAGALDEA